MLFKNIPEDINIELLLSYLPKDSFKVVMKGLHKRNVYNDIIDIEEENDGRLLISVGRDSIYNALPEYMFHSIDRFNNLPKLEEKEKFAEELEKQEKEKERAYRFFAPIDILLLLFRVEARERLRAVTEADQVLVDILGDRLTERQRSNRFIRQALPFLPYCKNMRGDKTLLTLFLRKVFMEEGIIVQQHEKESTYCDTMPRYEDCLGASLGESYVGNIYDETVMEYEIRYWPEECNEHFSQLLDEIELFRQFVQDYLLSVEDVLQFTIIDDNAATLRLSDDVVYNYLGYNTNL